MNLERWQTKHNNEFNQCLLNEIKWNVVYFRRFRLFHFLLKCATVFVLSFMKFCTYYAFYFNDEHLTNAFLKFWFFASIVFWKRKTLIFDVIISSIIITLLDFVVTKNFLTSVNFFVSNEILLNDCVDCLDEDEFQHNVNWFLFVENDFLQSCHVNNFFRNQFEHSRRICIN
jgi:hypothetical protein